MRAAPALNRTGLVGAAVELTRESGLSGVTMRALAGRFGVTPMALYRHVADREELVRLVADRVGEQVEPALAAGSPWEERVRAWAAAQRAVLRRHPGVAAWLIDNGPAGPQAYRLLELLTAALAAGGLDDAEVARGATLIMSWTFSRVAIEDRADVRSRQARPDRSAAFVTGLAGLDPAAHPTATRVGAELFTLPMQEVFDTGLDWIIAGLRAGRGG